MGLRERQGKADGVGRYVGAGQGGWLGRDEGEGEGEGRGGRAGKAGVVEMDVLDVVVMMW